MNQDENIESIKETFNAYLESKEILIPKIIQKSK